ncbi:hypothetical protein Ancab_022756 [Ancistrocladus abbreviatus]
MDGGELYRVSSARWGNSAAWRDSGREVFSRSARDEDDEEAFRWAALEKLPRYNRVRKGILADAGGLPREIDIDKLGFQEEEELLERLVKIADEDHERFLLRLRDRIDGIELTGDEALRWLLVVAIAAMVKCSGASCYYDGCGWWLLAR